MLRLTVPGGDWSKAVGNGSWASLSLAVRNFFLGDSACIRAERFCGLVKITGVWSVLEVEASSDCNWDELELILTRLAQVVVAVQVQSTSITAIK